MATTVDEGIIIPIRLDSSHLKSELKTGVNDVENFVKDIKKSFDSINKLEVFQMDKNKLKKNIDEIQNQINSLKDSKLKLSAEIETKDIKNQLNFIEEQSKKLQEKLVFYTEVKESKGKSLKTLDKEIKDLKKKLEEKHKIIIDNPDTKSFKTTKKEIREIEKQLNELENTRELKLEINRQNYAELKAGMEGIKKLAIGVGVGVGAISAALIGSTKQAMDFETQFAEVRTLISDMPDSGLEELKQGLVDLSKQTGILTNESIPAMYQAISASVPADNVVAFLETASKNAIGGVTDLQTSVDGLTNILNAYNMEQSEVTHVSDLMFETMKNGKTTIGELSRSYYNVIPIAASTGVAFEDISAAMATITAQGTPTAQATTQLRQMIVELSDEGSQAGKTFQKLAGQTFREFIASGKNLQDALKIMEKQAKSTNTGLSNLFGSIEAGQAALGLTGESSARFTADLEHMANAAGATEAAFEKINETPAMRIKKIQAAFSTLTLEIGRALLPTAEKLIETVEKNLPKITSYISKAGDVVVFLVRQAKLFLPILVGLGTGFVALNVALAITAPAGMGVAGAIGAITTAFIGLNASTGGLVLAIGAVAFALAELLLNMDKVILAFDKIASKLGFLSSQMREAARETDKLTQAFEDGVKEASAENEEIDRLIKRYKELQANQKRTAEQDIEFRKIYDALGKLLPEFQKYVKLGDAIDTNTNAMALMSAKNLKAIEDSEEAMRSVDNQIKLQKENQIKLEDELNDKRTYGLLVIGEEEDYQKRINESKEKENELLKQKEELQRKNSELQKQYTTDRKAPLISETDAMMETGQVAEDGTGKGKSEADPFETLKRKWQALVEIHKNTIKDEEECNQAIKEADQKYYNDVIALATSTYQKLVAEGKDKTDSEKAYLQQLIDMIAKFKGKLEDSVGKTFLDELKEHWQELVSATQNAVNSIANMFNSLWDAQITNIENVLEKQLDAMEKALDRQLTILEDQYDELMDYYDKEIEATKEKEEEKEDIISDTQKRIEEINEEIGEHMTEEEYNKLAEQRDALEEKLIAEQEALAENQAFQQELQNQKELAEQEYQARKEQAELQYQANKEKAERDAAIKTAQIKRKQAIMDKATGIMNATISLFTGIASAAASGSMYGVAAPFMIPFLVSMMVAAAAGQIGAIAATPLPEIPQYSTGGYVPAGNEQYYSGLVGKSGNDKDKTLIWASEGERVLNHAETKQWEYYQSRELRSVKTTNNSPTVNLGGITVNAGNTNDAKKIANITSKEVAKSLVQVITRGYS